MFEIEVSLEQIRELYKTKFKVDFDKLKLKLPRSVPGQWIKFKNKQYSLLGYYSHRSDSSSKHYLRYCGPGDDPSEYIKNELNKLLYIKKQYWGADKCGRLVHGESDGFPGVVLDKYKNCAIIKYEDVGFDTYREVFTTYIQEQFKLQLFVQENDEKRLDMGLPSFSESKITYDIETSENNIHFVVQKQIVQKAGFYHDHKINRQKMLQSLLSQNFDKPLGLDLFSYVGGWGMHMLAGKVDKVEFVDQGDLAGSIEKTLEKNNFNHRGEFIRNDVFTFLEGAIKEKKKYQVICCDPPAFAKSRQQIDSAKKGYSKLIELISHVMCDKGMFFFGSCTHYIDLLELDNIIRTKMQNRQINLSLIDIGTQAPDHTNSGLSDKSNYIKYLSYNFQRENYVNLA